MSGVTCSFLSLYKESIAYEQKNCAYALARILPGTFLFIETIFNSSNVKLTNSSPNYRSGIVRINEPIVHSLALIKATFLLHSKTISYGSSD